MPRWPFLRTESARSQVAANMTRRSFLQSSLALGASTASSAYAAPTTQVEPDGFFTLDRGQDRWWLITPEGERFFIDRLESHRPCEPALPGEHPHLARQVRREHDKVDPRVGRPESQAMGIQHGRLGPRGDCSKVEALPRLHGRRVSDARDAVSATCSHSSNRTSGSSTLATSTSVASNGRSGRTTWRDLTAPLSVKIAT